MFKRSADARTMDVHCDGCDVWLYSTRAGSLGVVASGERMTTQPIVLDVRSGQSRHLFCSAACASRWLVSQPEACLRGAYPLWPTARVSPPLPRADMVRFNLPVGFTSTAPGGATLASDGTLEPLVDGRVPPGRATVVRTALDIPCEVGWIVAEDAEWDVKLGRELDGSDARDIGDRDDDRDDIGGARARYFFKPSRDLAPGKNFYLFARNTGQRARPFFAVAWCASRC